MIKEFRELFSKNGSPEKKELSDKGKKKMETIKKKIVPSIPSESIKPVQVTKITKREKIERVYAKTEKTLDKLYSLLSNQFQYEKKMSEMKSSFEKMARSKDSERYEKLLLAIKSSRSGTSETDTTKPEKKSHWLLWIAAIAEMFEKFWSFFKGKLIPKLLKGIGHTVLRWGKKLVGFFEGFWKNAKKIITKLWDGVKWVSEKFMKILKPLKEKFEKFVAKIEDIPIIKTFLKGISKTAGKIAGKVAGSGAGEAIGKKLEKIGIKKALSTAVKVGSKTLEGAKGVFKFLTKASGVLGKIPVLGLAIAGTQGYFDIRDSITAREKGQITDSQLEKVVIKELGNLFGGAGGAELGAVAGSFIPIPVVGTLTGALVGGLAGSWGGKWLAGKLFDYFKGHTSVPELKKKKASKVPTSAVHSAPMPKPTGSPATTGSISSPSSGGSSPISASPIAKSSGVHDVSKQNFSLSMPASSGSKPSITNNSNVIPTSDEKEGNSTATGAASVRDSSIQHISKKQFSHSTI